MCTVCNAKLREKPCRPTAVRGLQTLSAHSSPFRSSRIATSMIEVVEVNDLETLAHYRLVWNSVFAATPNASFFQTFDWFDAYWRHFGDGQRMRVLFVFGSGEPIGVVPLCVRRESYRVGT